MSEPICVSHRELWFRLVFLFTESNVYHLYGSNKSYAYCGFYPWSCPLNVDEHFMKRYSLIYLLNGFHPWSKHIPMELRSSWCAGEWASERTNAPDTRSYLFLNRQNHDITMIWHLQIGHMFAYIILFVKIGNAKLA